MPKPEEDCQKPDFTAHRPAIRRAIPGSFSVAIHFNALKLGKLKREAYDDGCDETTAIHGHSVTKSVVALLFGIALDQGLLESVDQRVLDFFKDYAVKRGERTIQRITLRDMLTMTAPYKYRFAPYAKYFASDDWVRASLDLLGGKERVRGPHRTRLLVGPYAGASAARGVWAVSGFTTP